MSSKFVCRKCQREFAVTNRSTPHCPDCGNYTNLISEDWQTRKGNNSRRSELKDFGRKVFKPGSSGSDKKYDNSSNQKPFSIIATPPNPRPSSVGSSFTGERLNKRAVLCGVTYKNKKFRLKGTVNDVRNMKHLLMENFNFPGQCIHVLTEEEATLDRYPTKANILESLKWLVRGCKKGDSLVFYFSGHGIQHFGSTEDELDGLDESLCPVDFAQDGTILDNEINDIIVKPLEQGVILHAIIDACHSGTVLDLMYAYDLEKGKWFNNMPSSSKKSTSGGLAICLSACEDGSTAADTSAFGHGMNGVLTYLFTNAIRENPHITYKKLLENIQDEIKNINGRPCSRLIRKFLPHYHLIQDPLLSSSKPFETSKTEVFF